MRAEIIKAYDHDAVEVVGPQPRLPRRRRYTSAQEQATYDDQLKAYTETKQRVLAEAGSFSSWLSSHLDEDGVRAAAQMIV